MLRPRHDLTPDEVNAIAEDLYAFNAGATGHRDGLDLGFIHEVDGERTGALVGWTWGGCCEIDLLWVREDHRGRGIGTQLLQAAIDEARVRECDQVLLSSYDFQAPGFYRRFGFEVVATIPDKPKGHTDHIMRLRLG